MGFSPHGVPFSKRQCPKRTMTEASKPPKASAQVSRVSPPPHYSDQSESQGSPDLRSGERDATS